SLPAVERWKIFDNLRRSLLPPALVILLVLGWFALPGSYWIWIGLVLLVLCWPLLLQLITGSIHFVHGVLRYFHLRGWSASVGPTAGQALLSIVFLADQSRLMVDAVVRTLVRLCVTRRHLLEWETAAATERRLGTSLAAFYRSMWLPPALAVILG